MLSMLSNARKALGIAAIPLICLLSVGCGSDKNPMAPDPEPAPQVEIKTPKFMVVTSVSARSFPSKKSNGDTWDWNPLSTKDQNPDVYATIALSGKDPFFRSVTVKDQQSADRPNLSTADKSSPQTLPVKLSATKLYTLALVDDDGLTADDAMGEMSFVPISNYYDNNAEGFSLTLTGSNSVKIEIHGTWEY